MEDDGLELGVEPHCPDCGTVLRWNGGIYSCGGCKRGFIVPRSALNGEDRE